MLLLGVVVLLLLGGREQRVLRWVGLAPRVHHLWRKTALGIPCLSASLCGSMLVRGVRGVRGLLLLLLLLMRVAA